VIAGDFNSHHTSWRYDSNDLNGIRLLQWAEENNLHLVFDAKDKGSFRSARWRRDYNPDLTFVSCESSGIPFPTTRKILSNFPNSQHRPVLMKTGNQIPLMQSMPLPRWNLQKADWAAFAKDMDSAIRWIPPTAENYMRFVGLTTTIAKKHIPRGYRKTYVPGWSEESEQLHQQYKLTGDQEIGRHLLESLDTERKNKWLSTVESMDFKTSSRKAWKVLNKLTGKSGSKNVCVSQKLTDSIASQIVETSRVKGDRSHTKTVKKLTQNLKKELPVDDTISRPFTVEETTHAIKLLKPGKAAGEDGIYNEFIKNLGPNSRKWLTNFYADILARNKLPSAFNYAKIVAILKPNKPAEDPKSYRPIALLSSLYKLLEKLLANRITPFIEKVVPVEQAGFREGRNCTDQVLSLTTHIETGFQKQLKTVAVFVDLSAAYDTVWRHGLHYKLMKAVPCRRITSLIINMLCNREFVVHLGDKQSRPRKLQNGLPQGSTLAPLLFNLYTHDLPETASRKFVYADDIALTHQHSTFESSEKQLATDLQLLNLYFKRWRLVPNAGKTEISTFHLNNRLASYSPLVNFDGKILAYNPQPKYLGVTLDRSLTYCSHLCKLSKKLGTRNNILLKLTGTTWGASADVLRTTGLSLVYSAGEYCAPVWLNSAHVEKVDVQLRKTMRCITGNIQPTPIQWLPALSHIAPPQLRRQQALLKEADKIASNPELPVFSEFFCPPMLRLKSRHPPYNTARELKQSSFNIKDKWRDTWIANLPRASLASYDPTRQPQGFSAPRREWCQLNRLRTECGRSGEFMFKCGWRDTPSCDCGAPAQSIYHIVHECPNRKYTGDPLDLLKLSKNAADWVKNLDINL
jgi:hypothetical protein